jgi:hypothetical protein
MTHRLAVLISGTGSNLQAILDAIDAGELPARVSLVLSNKAGAAGLARAERAGVPAQAIDHRGFPDRASFDQAMIERIDAHGADTVVLAGFMRILSPGFVHHYQGRLINIHPSLLPKYPGLNTPCPGAGSRRPGARLLAAFRHRRAGRRPADRPGPFPGVGERYRRNPVRKGSSARTSLVPSSIALACTAAPTDDRPGSGTGWRTPAPAGLSDGLARLAPCSPACWPRPRLSRNPRCKASTPNIG